MGQANVFNPAALAMLASYYLFHAGESWWGAVTDVDGLPKLILMAAGVYITNRVNKIPLVLTFFGTRAAAVPSPHADSRRMAFDSNGNVFNANDGGLFRLSSPNTGARTWAAVMGSSASTLRPTEFDSVSYDPLTNIVMGGAQDVGSGGSAASDLGGDCL